jgi:signal transduction histidine kinase/ActR/RegA family two-component response regulator
MTSIHDDDPGSRSGAARAPASAACPPPSEWERLARRKDELETVLGAGRIGYCRLGAAGAVLEANSQFKAEWGWPPDQVLSWDAVESRVDVGDRGRFGHAVRQALAGAAPVDITVRVRAGQRQEDTRWLALRGCVVRGGDDAGSAHLVLTSRNVTSEHLAFDDVLDRSAQLLGRERQSREAAEAANRAKDEFLSVISHELRSPLNAILGWNRILALKCGTDPEVAAITPRVEQSAKAQLKMVNDLLDLGRVSTGKLKVEPRPMQLARVARLAIDAARPAAAAKGIEIATRFAPGAGELRADPDRLQQVVGNLLSNAVKFTGGGGRITVGLREDGAFTELTVEDTGQGIAPELLPHIFDRFRQGDDDSSNRQASGLGLGLTLVREIVTLHGGSVSAHSAGAGAGATFSVRLPAVRAAAGSSAEVEGAARELPERRQTLEGLSFLVVDDELEARTVVAEMLQLEGASVTVTDSAPSALHQLQAQGAHFDIVVTDIGMPMEDGYSLVRKLRSSQAGRRMLAIAVTGYVSRSDVAAALDAGFDLHVPKPVDFDTFVPLVRRLATWRQS